jgi:hypothetical protein
MFKPLLFIIITLPICLKQYITTVFKLIDKGNEAFNTNQLCEIFCDMNSDSSGKDESPDDQSSGSEDDKGLLGFYLNVFYILFTIWQTLYIS